MHQNWSHTFTYALGHLFSLFFLCPATKETWPKTQPAGQRPSRVSERAARLSSFLPHAQRPPMCRILRPIGRAMHRQFVPVHLHREETPWALPLLFPSNPINPFTVSIRHQHKNYSPLNDESVQSNGSTHDALNLMQVTDEVIGPTMAFTSWSPSSGYHSADPSRHDVRQEHLYKSPIIPSSNSFPITRNPPRNTTSSLLFFNYHRLRWAS